MKLFEKRKDGNHRQIYFCGMKVLSYHKKEAKDKVFQKGFCEERELCGSLLVEKWEKEATSLRLWNKDYYVKSYPNLNYYNMTPWDHYVKYGWKLGLIPSEIFDGNWYVKQYSLKQNPLLHYLSHGRYHCYYAFYKNPFPLKPSVLKSYLAQKAKRRTKKVVYTALVGDYDELMSHSYLDPDWDYVCFTDNKNYLKQKQVGPWEIWAIDKNLELDNTRKNRYYKINPHIVLPEYDESIYVDSNINILTPFIFDYVRNAGKSLVVPRHFGCDCIYKHFEWAYRDYIFRPNADCKDKLDCLRAMMERDEFPENYGFTENNLLYRKHSADEIKNIMNDWWYLIKHYSKRDQLSFCYVLWKHGISPADLHIDNLRSDNENFAFIIHKSDVR